MLIGQTAEYLWKRLKMFTFGYQIFQKDAFILSTYFKSFSIDRIELKSTLDGVLPAVNRRRGERYQKRWKKLHTKNETHNK